MKRDYMAPVSTVAPTELLVLVAEDIENSEFLSSQKGNLQEI